MRASLQHTSGPRTVTMIVTNIPTLTPSTTASVKLLGSTWKMVLTKVSDLWSLSVDIWMAWASLEHCGQMCFLTAAEVSRDPGALLAPLVWWCRCRGSLPMLVWALLSPCCRVSCSASCCPRHSASLYMSPSSLYYLTNHSLHLHPLAAVSLAGAAHGAQQQHHHHPRHTPAHYQDYREHPQHLCAFLKYHQTPTPKLI